MSMVIPQLPDHPEQINPEHEFRGLFLGIFIKNKKEKTIFIIVFT
jgi:hypothetical protein